MYPSGLVLALALLGIAGEALAVTALPDGDWLAAGAALAAAQPRRKGAHSSDAPAARWPLRLHRAYHPRRPAVWARRQPARPRSASTSAETSRGRPPGADLFLAQDARRTARRAGSSLSRTRLRSTAAQLSRDRSDGATGIYGRLPARQNLGRTANGFGSPRCSGSPTSPSGQRSDRSTANAGARKHLRAIARRACPAGLAARRGPVPDLLQRRLCPRRRHGRATVVAGTRVRRAVPGQDRRQGAALADMQPGLGAQAREERACSDLPAARRGRRRPPSAGDLIEQPFGIADGTRSAMAVDRPDPRGSSGASSTRHIRGAGEVLENLGTAIAIYWGPTCA